MQSRNVILSYCRLYSRQIRDRPEIPQVLFIFCSRKRGGGVEPPENRKLEEKPEEKLDLIQLNLFLIWMM